MSEFGRPNFNKEYPGFQDFLFDLRLDIANPSDPGRANSASAIVEELDRPGSPLVQPLGLFTKMRRASANPEKINLLHSTLIYFALQEDRPVPQSPEENQDNVRRFIDLYEMAPSYQTSDGLRLFKKVITEALYTRELQTTTSSRYNALEYWLQRNRDRYPEGARVLDLGCSTNHGLKSIKLKDTMGAETVFSRIEILDKRGEVDPEQTADYNKILAQPSILSEGIGIDIDPPQDEDDVLWARSCLRHAEHRDQNFMETHDIIDLAQPPNTRLIKADCTDEADMARVIREYGRSFHAISANTTFYQMARKGLAVVLRAIPELLAEDGFFLLQEAAGITGPNIDDISLHPSSWGKRDTRPWFIHVWDNAEKRWHKEWAESPTSRYTQLYTRTGSLALSENFK